VERRRQSSVYAASTVYVHLCTLDGRRSDLQIH